MADATPERSEFGPSPDPLVINALNSVYVPALTAMEQFHRQKGRILVRNRYMEFKRRYKCLTGCAHDWRHCLLRRIDRLGGEVDSMMLPVEVSNDIAPAFQLTHELLDTIYDAAREAAEVAKDARDTPSRKILMGLQVCVDHHRCEVEAWQRQAREMGESYAVALMKADKHKPCKCRKTLKKH